MSAFVMDPQSISAAIRFAVTQFDRSGNTSWAMRSVPGLAGVVRSAQSATSKDCVVERLCRLAWILNHKAVRGRYRDRKSGFRPWRVMRPRLPVTKTNWIDAVKALECLNYQCAEDPVTDSEAGKALNRLVELAAIEALHSLPQWNAAKWG